MTINGVTVTAEKAKYEGRYRVQRRTIGRRGLYFVVCRYTCDIINKEPLRECEAERFARVLNEEFYENNFKN